MSVADNQSVLDTSDAGAAKMALVGVIFAFALHILTVFGSLNIEYGVLFLVLIVLPLYVGFAYLVDDIAGVDNGALLVLLIAAGIVFLIVGSQMEATQYIGFTVDIPQIIMYELLLILGAGYVVASIE